MSYGSTPPYSGPPGWGGWVPPPPKPGVVPLAPLRLGDILGGAFATIGRHWKQLLGTAFTAYGLALVAIASAIAIACTAHADRLDRVLDSDVSPGWDDVAPLVYTFGAVYVFGLFVVLVANALICASCPAVLQDAVLGHPSTFGRVWRHSVRRVWSVLGAVLITALIVAVPLLLIGTAFIALIVTLITLSSHAGEFGWLILFGFLGALATGPPAVWLWVKFCLAPAAAVFEGQGAVAALTRSSQLVRGDWWRIFGISLLAHGMAAVASYVVQLPFSFLNVIGPSLTDDASTSGAALTIVITSLAFGLVALLIGQALTAAFPQLVVSLLYVDRRIREENLAPALAEAAAGAPAAH
ncbi:DUF7847 domain-containing protein [Streptomyces xantholiticus]|uniref:DUF7847 domain-containing protein n=1 Tax=Streptomyces xantholiticus TaxID=68285 RepID=UPI00167BDD09|nr:hypothetical protein [Streptomyces xantholiticus]GGW63183.1 hypothetical protein GCM10010381_55340 [Streptomyces xantholiticus]